MADVVCRKCETSCLLSHNDVQSEKTKRVRRLEYQLSCGVVLHSPNYILAGHVTTFALQPPPQSPPFSRISRESIKSL